MCATPLACPVVGKFSVTNRYHAAIGIAREDTALMDQSPPQIGDDAAHTPTRDQPDGCVRGTHAEPRFKRLHTAVLTQFEYAPLARRGLLLLRAGVSVNLKNPPDRASLI
jgi:hypothetical protein